MGDMPARRTSFPERTLKAKVSASGKARNSGKPSTGLKGAQFRAITRAISDPTRYEILERIAREDDCTCADLRQCSLVGAATLSHHLKELEAAGLITIARSGKFALPSFRRQVWKTYLAQLSQL